MITEIEDYFTKGCGRCGRFDTPECSARIWSDGQNALRALCRGMGLSEHLKWGHPAYMHAGRNIAIIGAFRDDFRLTFLNAALVSDPDRILVPGGPNTAQPNMVRFHGASDVERLAPAIRACLAEAMAHAEAGTTPPKTRREVALPDEMVAALDEDPALAEAFAALTPGRQRSYAIALDSAKKPETRRARIEKFRDRIIAGKGAQER